MAYKKKRYKTVIQGKKMAQSRRIAPKDPPKEEVLEENAQLALGTTELCSYALSRSSSFAALQNTFFQDSI
jgi:hypothetical protein